MSQFLPDVRIYAGVPPVGAFASILGTPIVINTVTNTPYYLAPGDTVTALAAGGGGGITALTGDVTASGTGSVAATLATVNGGPGSYTYASITVNGKGLVTAASNGANPLPLVTINAQTASYTVVAADCAPATPTLIKMNVAGANTLTFPLNATTAIAIGSVVGWMQYGAGTITLTPASGVTLRSSGSLTSRALYSSGTATKIATDEWLIEGDTT